MIGNEVTLRTSLKDSVRVRRIELVRITVRFTSEELERVQSELEKRISGESLGAREEKEVELIVSKDDQIDCA